MPMSFGGISKSVVATKIVAADGLGDYTNIQTAINSLPVGGGVVYVKEGTYTITSAIEILDNNVELRGAGNSTIIYLADSSNDNVIEIGDGSTTLEGIRVTNLQINGNSANQTSNGIGIYLRGNPGSILSLIYIEDCYIHDCLDHGIKGYKCDGTVISRNRISSCVNGIDLQDVSTVVSQNFINNNLGNGISFLRVSLSGLDIAASIISANYSFLNQATGIRLSDTDNLTVNGNTCYNNSQAGGNNVGIVITGSAWNNLITSNQCFDNQGTATQEYGIWIYESDVQSTVVTGNSCHGNATSNFTDNGTGTIIGHNYAP